MDWFPMHDPMRLHREAPWQHRAIWLIREEWPEAQFAVYNDINPALNIIGLYWSPAIDGQGPPEFRNPMKKEE